MPDSSCIAVAGGMSSLLQQAHAYAWLDSALILLGVDGEVRFMNPAADRLGSRLTPGRNADPELRGLLALPALRERVDEACAAHASIELAHTYFLDRNIEVPVTLRIRPVIDSDSGQVQGAMLTIAEEALTFDRWHLLRLQAERQELREQIVQLSQARIENERLIRILLAEMPIALILFDQDRKVVQLNRAAAALFGTQRREALGRHCDDYLDCYAEAGCHCPVMDARRRIEMEEITYVAVDGEARQLLRTAVVLEDGGQQLVLEAFIDISDRKKAETRLTRYREELENIVSERTAKLEQTIEELEAFSYTVSHDLRSPLRAIDGFSQALLDEYGDQLDDVACEYLDRSRRAAQRMGRLIDDLLNLSRISRVRLQREELDLSALGAEVADELLAGGGERAVKITIQSGLRADADPGLVRSLLMNLMGNAWKFTAACEDARIELGATSIDGERVFFVRDNGEGFSMKYAGKLFHPFQVMNPQSKASGTGIGLATVQRIVHRHSGVIWADAQPGRGATFFFTLEP